MKTRTRTTLSLDGLWNFSFEEGVGLSPDTDAGFAGEDVMPVPGVFDVTPRYFRKRGLAKYSRTFTVDTEGKAWKVRLGGLGISARIWVDERFLGDVAIAYNAYAFEVGTLTRGEHRITIAIDNMLTEATPFFKPNYDFYGFGGLYRSVWLEALPAEGPHLEQVQVRTTSWADREVELRFVFEGDVPEHVRILYAFDTESAVHVAELCPGADSTLRVRVPEGKLWSPETPHLHRVTCSLANGDTLTEEFGIRVFEAKEGRFFLNGEAIRLLGFNRHESHLEMGPATTETLMLEDLHHLKEMHCNFIRGAHYPQDERFLELCDRLGFLVWEEGLAWGNGGATLADPVFVEGQIDQMRRMVRKSVNHPSVVIWAFLNEFDSASDEGVALCQKLVDTLHAEDPSRPVSFACNRGTIDRCVPLVDIVAYNTYPGWIWGFEPDAEPEAGIAADRDALVNHFLRVCKPGAPIMVSEMGVCGVYGQREDAAAQWTEEFQARFLEHIISAVFERPEIQGLCIWQLTDCLSFHRMTGGIRQKPFAQNLAGVFDVYRRRKLAARTVEHAFASLSNESRL